MTEKERSVMIDLIFLLEAYVRGQMNWDGSTRTQAQVTLVEARKLIKLIKENNDE